MTRSSHSQMAQRCLPLLIILLITGNTYAAPTLGVDSTSSHFFREFYQYGELNHYLDNGSEYVTWETETTGQWSLGESQVFSINGNSWRWNKYYHNGFRVDSRFSEGGSLFHWNMLENSLNMDIERGRLYFDTDVKRDNYISLTGNMGGIGGITSWTGALINLFHNTASERALKPINDRNHIVGAGQLETVFALSSKNGKQYYQHIYTQYGLRNEVVLDETGICGTTNKPYWQVQLDGELPFVGNNWSLNYILNGKYRSDWCTEFYFNPQEQADLMEHSASLYVKRDSTFTTGLTYALSHTKAHTTTLERNMLDQDGEGMEPWYIPGKLHEVNWAVNYTYPILPWLKLHVDAYNSVCHFTPTDNVRPVVLYTQYMDSARTDFYNMSLTSSEFTAGLLENEVRLTARKQVLPWLTVYGSVAATLDGVVLRQNSLVMPSWEAEASVAFHPAKWFEAEILLGNYRTRYGWNMVTLLSPDYMNAALSYTGSGNRADQWGGQYLTVDKGLPQPQYAVLDIPIRFMFGKGHQVSILSTARKYYNCQTITYEDGTSGATALYRLTKAQPMTEAGWIYATPFYLSNTIQYKYTGRYAFVSVSWQSYQMSGTSLVGSGPLSNDVCVLSYSMAKPNVNVNISNPTSPVRALGRLDQDRAYIARIQVGANITYNWGVSLNFHFKDGTPFYSYHGVTTVNENGDKDLTIIPGDSRGINVADNHFGKRKDAMFNLDLRLRYRGNINCLDQRPGAPGAIPFEIQLAGYNLIDFGTEMLEYCFDEYLELYKQSTRMAMTQCVPRGLMLTLKFGF